MPSGEFADLTAHPSWIQYHAAASSLVKALDLDDPEDTLFAQLTISEVSILSLALLILVRVFPELTMLAGDLSDKLKELSREQKFLTKSTDDGE